MLTRQCVASRYNKELITHDAFLHSSSILHKLRYLKYAMHDTRWKEGSSNGGREAGGLQNENLCHEQVGWSREKIGAGYFFPQMNQKANYWLRGK